MGRSLNNLDGLLQMPYGCGEQNMGVLAPNIYILQYLEGTKQLTAAVREMATGYIQRGLDDNLLTLLSKLPPKNAQFFSHWSVTLNFMWILT